MKKLVSLILVGAMVLSLVACKKEVTKVAESVPAAAPVQVNSEYTKKTVNENGVTIYGKIVDENTASEAGKKVIKQYNMEDQDSAKRGVTFTYSEYDSQAYGGRIIIRTNNKSGGQVLCNEEGECFMTGDKKSAGYDLEEILAKYRLGNAMAEAIDKKVKGK